ncbi:hypothetical protein ANO11243_086090 [Dothideomycetidae sp. 11243]|nr:hypothetical protein ANO11243_086090 [fungal sp. No.11243]
MAQDGRVSSTHAPRQRAKSPNRVLAEAEEQWIFDEDELTHTPSIQDGMPIEKEKELRAKGINFIRQVGIMLKLPELTLSTGAIFFNRYLMRSSLVDKPGTKALHHYTLGATCLFLATKVEESCRKMKDIVIACCRVAQKNPNLIIDEQSKDFWKWRDTILLNEDVLLETLCFDLTIEAPHKQLFEMLKYYRIEHNKQVRNAAWAFVTDSNMTQLCLLCSSRTIAVAALYAGARFYDIQIPDTQGQPWWTEQGVRSKDMVKAANYMCQNYEAPPQKGDGSVAGGQSIYAGPDDPETPWEKTRLRNEQAIGSPLVAGQLGLEDDRARSASGGSPGSKRRLSSAKGQANGRSAEANGKAVKEAHVQEKEDASEEGEVEE